MPHKFTVRVSNADSTVQEIAISEDQVLTIGRHPDCDISLSDPSHTISGRHATIRNIGGRCHIEDHSMNGTQLDGRELRNEQTPWLPGSIVTIDPYELRLEELSASQSNASTPVYSVEQYCLQVQRINATELPTYHELKNDSATVGKAPGNTIVIKDDRFDDYHLVIRRTTAGFQVIDLDSVNGTKLDGQYLSPQQEYYWKEGVPCSILEWNFALIDLRQIRQNDISVKLGGSGVIPPVQHDRESLIPIQVQVVGADGRYTYAVTLVPQYEGWRVTPTRDRVLNAGEKFDGNVNLSIGHAVRSGHYPTYLAILRKLSGLWQIAALHPLNVLVEGRPQLTPLLDLKDGKAKLGEAVNLVLKNDGNTPILVDMAVGDPKYRLAVTFENMSSGKGIAIEPGDNQSVTLRPGLARRWGPWRYLRFFGRPEEMGFTVSFEPKGLREDLDVAVISVPLLPPFLQILVPAFLLFLLILFGVLLRPQVELHGEIACFDATPTPIYSNVASSEITRNLCADVSGIGWMVVKVDGREVTPVSTTVSGDYRGYQVKAEPASLVSVERRLPFYVVQATATPVATVQYVPEIREIAVSPAQAYCGQTAELDVDAMLDHQLEDEARLVLTASRGGEKVFELREPKKIGDSNLYRFAKTLGNEITCGEKFDTSKLLLEVSSFASNETREPASEILSVIPPICTVRSGATFYARPLIKDRALTPVPAHGAENVFVIEDRYRHRDGTEWIRVSYDDQEWYVMTMYLDCEMALNKALDERLFSDPAPYDEPTGTPVPTSTNTPVPPPPAPPTPVPTPTPALVTLDQSEGWYAGFRPEPGGAMCQLEGEGFSGVEKIWLVNKETKEAIDLTATDGRINKTPGTTRPCNTAAQWKLRVQKENGEVKELGLQQL